MSERSFNAAAPLEALKELCGEQNYPFELEGNALLLKFEASDAVGGAFDARLSALEPLKILRATALAQGSTLAREYLSDALMFCNIWNGRRPCPRAVVVNVEEKDRDLAFMLDMNLKIDPPVSTEFVLEHFLNDFLRGASEFFDAVGKTFATEYQD